MAGWEEPLHRCPACGSGACWTAPLQPDEGHEARALLFCADCGAFLGEEHDWHGLGAGDEVGTAPLRRWLRLYRRVRRSRLHRAHRARRPRRHTSEGQDAARSAREEVADHVVLETGAVPEADASGAGEVWWATWPVSRERVTQEHAAPSATGDGGEKP